MRVETELGKRSMFLGEKHKPKSYQCLRGVLAVSDTRYPVCDSLVVLQGVIADFAVLANGARYCTSGVRVRVL